MRVVWTLGLLAGLVVVVTVLDDGEGKDNKASLQSSDAAVRKTFELVADTGPAPEDFDSLFTPLQADPPGSVDGAQDVENMPLTDEPQQVRDDLRDLRSADRADEPRHRS